jgi:hypothetical protein
MNGVQEVAGSNPVASTFFRNEAFGVHVEGLFLCGDEGCSLSIAFKQSSALG